MASPNISFSQIPSSVLKPGKYFELNTSNALNGLTAQNDSVVILAQKTSAGTATANTPYQIFSDSAAQGYFGAGSVAHLTCRAALQANANAAISCVGIADAGGAVDATGSIVIGDTTASAAGTLSIWIGDVQVDTNYASGATKDSITAAAHTNIANVANYIPVIDSTSAGTITMVARNKGTLGNHTALSAKASAGLSSITVNQPTGGATDPDLGAYDTTSTPCGCIASAGYSVIVNTLPTSTAMGKVKSLVDFVSGPMEQRPATHYAVATDKVGSLATIQTLAGTTMNDGRLSLGYIAYTNDMQAKTESYKIAGAYGAMIAYNPDPAIPYDGLVLAPVAPCAVVDRLTRTQQEAALAAGVTPFEVVGNNVTIVRAVSTYTTTLGVPDPTLRDITTYRTLDYVRSQVRTRLTLRFPRSKLSSRTPAKVKAEVLDVLYLLEGLEIVQNVTLYRSGVIVEIDTQDTSRLDVKIPTNIVQGLHVLAGVVDLIL